MSVFVKPSIGAASVTGLPKVLPPGGWRAGFGLALLYCLCHGLMLIDQGVFWDDWILYRVPRSVIWTNIDTTGSHAFAYLHVWMSSPDFAVALGNWFTFLAYLTTGLLVWDIFRRTRGLTATEAWTLAALVIVLPMNLSRNLMINNQYAACQLSFWLGFWLFSVNETRPQRSWVLVALSVVLFFGGFLTNSFLVFFALVPLWGLWARQPPSWAAARHHALRLAPWLLLPVAYWLVRGRYFQPYGIHRNLHYNEVTLDKLVRAPLELARTGYFSFVKLLAVTPLALTSGVVAVLTLVIGSLLLWRWRGQWLPAMSSPANRQRALLGIAVGGALFALGAFPYVAVGHLPTQVEWSNRHQLLLPIGAAALLFYALQLAGALAGPTTTLSQRVRQIGLVLLVLLCVGQNIKFYLDYERDWLKQVSMMRQFKALPDVQANTSFLVEDKTRDLNVFERSYRFYEYAAHFRQAFNGQESRFAITPNEMESLRDALPGGLQDLAGHPEHLLTDYRLTAPQKRIVIEHGVPISDGQVLLRTLSGPVHDDPAAPIVRLRTEAIVPGTAPALYPAAGRRPVPAE